MQSAQASTVPAPAAAGCAQAIITGQEPLRPATEGGENGRFPHKLRRHNPAART